MKNLYLFVTMFCMIVLLSFCTENRSSRVNEDGTINAQEVYKTYCILCHGATGNLGLNGAADLQTSSLNLQQRIDIIANGRKTMAPFKGTLSQEEIKAVAQYSMTLSDTNE